VPSKKRTPAERDFRIVSFSWVSKEKARRLRYDPGAALLDRVWISQHMAGRKRAQREIHSSLSAMLADYADCDIRRNNNA
jgi:hypothetical protein